MADMLGFGGRVGRLHFLFGSIAYTMLMAAAVVAVVLMAPGRGWSWGAVAICALLIAPAYLWASYALLARRIRDIGWRPLPVILGWFALSAIDRVIAALVPAIALSKGGTALGMTADLLMLAALLLLPGNGDSDFTPMTFGTAWRPPEPPTPARRIEPKPLTPAGFGRRGLS